MLHDVMLIDDDEIDNETHSRVLRKSGKVRDIIVYQYADEALEFLKSKEANEIDLIILDINMPRMNGFEFLEAYKELANGQKAQHVVVMLTTSGHPGDAERARKAGLVADFRQKPLTLDMFEEIIAARFPEEAADEA